ncbi:MAG TPA: hypothetical protein PLC98_02235 [Anaerolineales bacterium]|nr:hypothetical protein [Anaerolineales bacterium]
MFLTFLQLVGMPVAVDIVQNVVFKRSFRRAAGKTLPNDVMGYWRGLSSGIAQEATRSQSDWRWGPRGRWPIGQQLAEFTAELILLGASGPRALDIVGEAAGRYIRRVPANVVANYIAGTILANRLDLACEAGVTETAYRSFTYGLDELNGNYTYGQRSID